MDARALEVRCGSVTAREGRSEFAVVERPGLQELWQHVERRVGAMRMDRVGEGIELEVGAIGGGFGAVGG